MYPVISLGSVEFESYTVVYLLDFILVALLLWHEFKKRQYAPKLFIGLYITGLFMGLIGSKLYYVFENWDAFTVDPFPTIFKTSGSGWYGGFILGGFGTLIFLKVNKLPILRFLDMLAPLVLIGQGFGRLGCFLAGCCYGTPSNLPWAVSFPNTLYPPYVKVHPTQLYEMLIYLTISILLIRLKTKRLKCGIIFGLYLTLTGLSRFIIEYLRPNPKIVAQFSAPQILAFCGILIGLYFIFRISQSVDVFSEIPLRD